MLIARFINQYSFMLLLGGIVAAIWFFVVKKGDRSLALQIVSVSLLALIVVGYFFIKPGAPALSADEVNATFDQTDRPILIEVFSKY